MRSLQQRVAALIVSAVVLLRTGAIADELTVEFEWGETPDCNTGKPSRVAIPVFVLGDVPEGTAIIKVRMRDLDAPPCRHGGGKVSYDGNDTVPAGFFRYKGPCPLREIHDYRWTATAFDAEGARFGRLQRTAASSAGTRFRSSLR